MAIIPIKIAKYIRSIWMTEKTIAYFQVDQNENLIHWGGSVDYYGLINLTLGQSIIDPLNFLEGLLPITEPLVLEFINLDDKHVAHIHLVPHQNETWILLLDAHSEHEQQQQMQQQLNELKLSTYEKNKLIQTLKEENRQLKKHHTATCRLLAKRLQCLATMCKKID